MTVFADVEPALKRLFERLDSAPQPASPILQRLLKEWRGRREGRVAPNLEGIGDLLHTELGRTAFVFVATDSGRDFSLFAGCCAVEPLLGTLAPGDLLSKAPQKRAAARFRRIFEFVHKSGEPLLADFHASGSAETQSAVELLALPVNDEVGGESAILGAFVTRPVTVSSLHAPRRRGMPVTGPLVFAFAWDAEFAEKVAAEAETALSPLEERLFEDGEHKARPLVDVHGRDAVVITSLHGADGVSVNDKLCRLLFFIETLKANGAVHVTAAVPYLAYMRKDRQTKPYDPVSSRVVGRLFEAVGTDGLIALEVHNLAAFQNAFRLPMAHLSAIEPFVDRLAAIVDTDPVAVVSPDLGGAKRAEAFREALESRLEREVARGIMDKQRSMGVVSGDLFAGDVADRHVIIVDDLIASGTTMARVAAACRNHGAREVSLVATHGLFAQGSNEALASESISRILVSDSIPSLRLGGSARARLQIVPVASLFAGEIRRRAVDVATSGVLPHP